MQNHVCKRVMSVGAANCVHIGQQSKDLTAGGPGKPEPAGPLHGRAGGSSVPMSAAGFSLLFCGHAESVYTRPLSRFWFPSWKFPLIGGPSSGGEPWPVKFEVHSPEPMADPVCPLAGWGSPPGCSCCSQACSAHHLLLFGVLLVWVWRGLGLRLAPHRC